MKKTNEIQKDRIAELAWMELIEAIKPRDISVTVNKGIVTLTGTVNSYAKKIQTEQIVSSIPGVISVVNRMEVKLNSKIKKSDEELTDDILNAFIKTINEPEENFSLKIENEWLSISGQVENHTGQKISVQGRLCKLEEVTKNEKRAQHHPAVITQDEMAYWEIFS